MYSPHEQHREQKAQRQTLSPVTPNERITMNKTFHSVWNASKQAYVAAAETVSAQGKPSSGIKVAAVMAGLMGSFLGQVAKAQTAPPPYTLPTGGQVSAGQASISQSGANLVINQSSNRASVNWQSFHVGKDAHVQFNQPSAASVPCRSVHSAIGSVVKTARARVCSAIDSRR